MSELIAQLREGEGVERRAAARALGRLGPRAEPAIPALIEAMKLSSFASDESNALGQIGPAAIPALLEAMEGEEDTVRAQCAHALGVIGPKAESTIPVLLKLLKDRSQYVRREAAIALGKIAPSNQNVARALSRLLESSEKPVRTTAARTLASMRPAGRQAVPSLIEALAFNSVGSNSKFPPEEVKALVKIGPPAIPALTEGLQHDKARVRAQCAWALELLGSQAKSATPKLIVLLNDGSSVVCERAILALGAIAPADKEAMRALVQVWDRKPWFGESFDAARVLGEVGQAAVPELIGALGGGENAARFAGRALAQIGSAAGPAVPALMRVLRGETLPVYSSAYSSAVQALAAIGPAAAPEVVKLVGGPDERVRRRAVGVFKKLGHRGAGAVPELADFLGRPDPALRAAAAEALSHIGLEAQATVP